MNVWNLYYILLGIFYYGCFGANEATVIRLAVRNFQTSGFSNDLIDSIVAEMKSKFGWNIRLVVEEQPTSPGSYEKLMRTYLPSNTYDIYELNSVWVAEFQGSFQDLSRPSFGFSDVCSDLSGASCDILSGFYQGFYHEPTKKLVAVPWAGDIGALYYRDDLITKYKSTTDFVPPPYTSYEQLENNAEFIMEAERNSSTNTRSTIFGWLFEGTSNPDLTLLSLEWINAFGGGTIVNGSGFVTIDNPNSYLALRHATNWVKSISPISLVGADTEQVSNLFKACNSPFMRNWASEWPRVGSTYLRCGGDRVKVKITRLPGAGSVVGWGFGISSSTANVSIATEIIRYLTSPSLQIARANTLNFFPTRRSVFESICSKNNTSWFGCFAYNSQAPLSTINAPSDECGPAYGNISLYVSTWVSNMLSNPPTDDDLKSQLSSVQIDLTSILKTAQPNQFCGAKNGVIIVCASGYYCLNEKCFDIVPVIVGVLVPLVLIIIVLAIVVAVMKWKRRKYDLAWTSYAVSWNSLELDPKPLGKGSFGIVYHGKYRNTEVAVKKLLYQDSSIEKEFQKETQILVSLRHPNIILFMGACFEKHHLAIITEYMVNGTLHSVLHNQKIQLDWNQRIVMLKDICGGMAFLHAADPPILHKDLKSPNILVDGDFHLKVADFGLSAIKESEKKVNSHGSGLSVEQVQFRGTLYWTAPEIMRDQVYTEKADVYSFGIICWEILTREKLYPDLHPLTVGYKVMVEGLRPTIPPECPDSYRTIIENCWNDDVEVRPTFDYLLKEFEKMRTTTFSKFINSFKDYKGFQSGQVQYFDQDPSIELDEISAEVSPPTGEVTVVIVDIGKWELLWEDPAIDMVRVISVYSRILRLELRKRQGFEVNMEGRICRVVFQDPLNAIEWCLRVQLELLDADWPETMLQKSYCSIVKSGNNVIRRGLLVAMGVHTGSPSISINPVSGRPEYNGSIVVKTAAICKLAQYGQILVSDTTFQLVHPHLSSLHELDPQIRVLGGYSFSGFTGIEKLIQILPRPLTARNFNNVDTPSKPHLVRGVSDFQRATFSDSNSMTDVRLAEVFQGSSFKKSFEKSKSLSFKRDRTQSRSLSFQNYIEETTEDIEKQENENNSQKIEISPGKNDKSVQENSDEKILKENDSPKPSRKVRRKPKSETQDDSNISNGSCSKTEDKPSSQEKTEKKERSSRRRDRSLSNDRLSSSNDKSSSKDRASSSKERTSRKDRSTSREKGSRHEKSLNQEKSSSGKGIEMQVINENETDNGTKRNQNLPDEEYSKMENGTNGYAEGNKRKDDGEYVINIL